MNRRKKPTEEERRDFILHDDLWKVITRIAVPLVLFSALSHIFKVFDAYMASTFGAIEVSAVVFVHQIKLVFDSIGTGLSLGGSILVARYFGGRDDDKASEIAGNVYALSLILALILLFLISFSGLILRIAHSPEELIPLGRKFLSVQMISSALVGLNAVFIGLEKAKGQSDRILFLNIMVLVVKMGLSAIFIFLLKLDVIMLAVATMIAQALLFLISMHHLTRKSNPVRLTSQSLRLRKSSIKSIVHFSLPIMTERLAFSFGKVWVSAITGFYGGIVVGALGISNQISGLMNMTANGFKDAELTVISQNLGNRNRRRAIGTFYRALIINSVVGILGFLILTVFMDPLTRIFSNGSTEFAEVIRTVLYYERFAFLALTLSSTIYALFYGFGMPRLVLILNVMRLFLFRIPPLIIFQKATDLGIKSVGISMMLSNILVGISTVLLLYIYRKKIWRPVGPKELCEENI